MKLFFDLVDRFVVRGLDAFGQPIALDDIKDDDPYHHDKDQGDTDALVIAENRRDKSAKEVSDARQQDHPDAATDRTEAQETRERHFPDAIEYTHRHAYTVDVFGNNDRKVAEFIDQLFDTWLGDLEES